MRVNEAQSMAVLEAATVLANGAILVDEFDRVIFDEVNRNYPMWTRIDKRLAPGETTGGFDQTAVQTARTAAVRSLSFSATSPTRAERTRRDIKAIVADLQFGIFDRSVYQQQGRRFGNIERRDVQDMVTACLRKWQTVAYEGDAAAVTTEFSGLRTLLTAVSLPATTSIMRGLNDEIVKMVNSSARDVRPTAIYTNARVIFNLELELLKMGHKLVYAPIQVGTTVFQLAQLATPVGFLPMIADPFNAVITGTPDKYPTFIVSEDKLSWQYVEPLGQAGSEPRTFEITLTNALDQQFKTLMFGALELLGGSNHHKRVDVTDRTTVVDPSA